MNYVYPSYQINIIDIIDSLYSLLYSWLSQASLAHSFLFSPISSNVGGILANFGVPEAVVNVIVGVLDQFFLSYISLFELFACSSFFTLIILALCALIMRWILDIGPL